VPWLGNASQGIALAGIAPVAIDALPVTRGVRVLTTEGVASVRPTDAVVELAAIPLEEAAPAIAAALRRLAEDEAYRAWTVKRQDVVRRTAVCTRDVVPVAGVVDLTAYLPFLARI
jgi:hypothetical protein